MAVNAFPCRERTSARYTATLMDETGAAVTLAVIQTLTLTFYVVDKESDGTAGAYDGTIINSRSAQNVLNANNVTVHATSGLVTWLLQPADQVISDTSQAYELHRARFDCTYTTGQAHWEADFLVENLSGLS